MVYHGRMPIAYITPSGNLAAGYLVQVRSLPNKKRKFVPQSDRLWLAPLDPEDEKRPDAKLLFYNTMLRRPDGVMIVTNGAQTDQNPPDGSPLTKKPVLNFNDNYSRRYPIETSAAIMHSWGYEPDSMNTPRVALTVNPQGHNPFLFAIGTKTHPVNGDDIGLAVLEFYFDKFTIGKHAGLPTYREVDGQATSLSLESPEKLRSFFVYPTITSETPEQIAEELYAYSDPNLIVAAAGAVYSYGSGIWQVAFKNRFNSLEEWQEYAEQQKK